MLKLIYKVAKAMALSIFIKKEILSKGYCTVGVKVYHMMGTRIDPLPVPFRRESL